MVNGSYRTTIITFSFSKFPSIISDLTLNRTWKTLTHRRKTEMIRCALEICFAAAQTQFSQIFFFLCEKTFKLHHPELKWITWMFFKINIETLTNCFLFTIDLHCLILDFFQWEKKQQMGIPLRSSLFADTFYVINPVCVCACACICVYVFSGSLSHSLFRVFGIENHESVRWVHLYAPYMSTTSMTTKHTSQIPWSCLDGWWCYLLCCVCLALPCHYRKFFFFLFPFYFFYVWIWCIFRLSSACLRACVHSILRFICIWWFIIISIGIFCFAFFCSPAPVFHDNYLFLKIHSLKLAAAPLSPTTIIIYNKYNHSQLFFFVFYLVFTHK